MSLTYELLDKVRLGIAVDDCLLLVVCSNCQALAHLTVPWLCIGGVTHWNGA